MRRRPVITVDGPSGAGKSTVAKALASTLGYEYMDTGAMYRAVAYAYSRQKEKPDLGGFLESLRLTFVFGQPTKVFLNGEEISSELRTPEISMLASALSQDSRVREYLTAMQRELGKEGGIVLEGRDTGSVVFPDAEVKFYLDADVDVRAQRRHSELSSEDSAGTARDELGKVKQEMEKRDRDDTERKIAPLVRPEGAQYIDTTHLDIDSVVRLLKKHVEQASDTDVAR
ncbi:MAG TPA: (d)CMP kinase [Syntrophorhabdales bacterium]|nr:(d)CMP kinase [Syntrophorhabdales bacterium]